MHVYTTKDYSCVKDLDRYLINSKNEDIEITTVGLRTVYLFLLIFFLNVR